MAGELAPVISALRKAHPPAARFVDELNAPAEKYPVLALTPSAEFLLLSVCAALETPGRHVVIFPAKHADFRVECFRAALRAAAGSEENVVVVTRRTTGIEYAVSQEPRLRGKFVLCHARDLDEIPDPLNIGGIAVAIVDLDSLDREIALGPIVSRLEGAKSLVMVTTRTESRAVGAAARRPDVNVVGLTRSQLTASDGLPVSEEAITEGWDWVSTEHRTIPSTLSAVDDKQWMKVTWRGSRHWRSAVYRGVANGIARRDLLRWTRVLREVVPVSHPDFEAALGDAARILAAAKSVAKMASEDLSEEEHSFVDLATDCFYRLRALAVPVRTYDKFAARHGPGLGFATQLDELGRAAAYGSQPPELRDALVRVAESLRRARDAIDAESEKATAVTSFLHGIVETNEPLTIVLSDDIEVAALYAHVESYVKWGGTERPTRAKLQGRGVAVIPAKALRTVEVRGRLVLANLPPYWLAREAYLRGADRVTAVVYPSERDRYSMIQARDRIVESFLFPASRQEKAIATFVGAPFRLPESLGRTEPLDADARRALEVAKQIESGPLPIVYDSTEFFADEDAFSRSMRRRASELAAEKASNRPSSLPRGAEINGVRVWFKEGTYLDCEADMSIDCVPENERTQSVKRAARLKAGDYVLIGEGNASVSTIVSIAGRLQAKSPRALETVESNARWRIAIDAYREEAGQTWAELLKACKSNGYSNKTPWTLMSYAAPWVWLPDDPKNFEAILKTVSPNDLYREREALWNASARLRRVSGRLKSLLKAEYKRRAAKGAGSEDADAVLDEEWGVRLADFEDIFEVKEVRGVEEPVTFRNGDRGRVKYPGPRGSA